MHHQLHSELDIDAPPEVVWEVLTDLAAYGEWNPFITSSVGTAEVGEKLVNRMEPPGGMAATDAWRAMGTSPCSRTHRQ